MSSTLKGLRVVLEVEELKILSELRKYCNQQKRSGHSISGYLFFCQDQAYGVDRGMGDKPFLYSDISNEIAEDWKKMSIKSRQDFKVIASKGPHKGENIGEPFAFERLYPLQIQQAVDALENESTGEWNMIEDSDSED